MEDELGSTVILLLMLLAVMLAYFVYLVHNIVQRQKRVERYLIAAARITSVCVGGMALPPVLQQVGRLFGSLCKEDPKDHNLEWVMALQQLRRQMAEPGGAPSAPAAAAGAAPPPPSSVRRPSAPPSGYHFRPTNCYAHAAEPHPVFPADYWQDLEDALKRNTVE